MATNNSDLEQQKSDHFRLRLYLAACVGWVAAIAVSAGLAGMFFAEWPKRLAGFGFGMVAVASEIDPTARLPWWLRAAFATGPAVGFLAV